VSDVARRPPALARAGEAFTAALDRPATLLAVFAFLLLLPAGAFGLFEPTETRYAEIAREMRASGDWITPRLDGIVHLHKPPLAYWAAAGGMALLGENAWGARLPVALASLATLLFTVRLARRRFGALIASPALAGWLLGSSVLFLAIGRTLASDPFLAAAVAGFWALAPSPWALALLGLGFLAKGPVVFVTTVLPVLLAAAWGRERRTLALLGPARGWLAFAVVALPWYLVVLARTPGLLGYFLGNQLWERFATTEHGRGGPPWYFAGVMLAGALPWTVALGPGAVQSWRQRASAEARLLIAWLAVPLVVFSLSGSKLPAYLLPCFPAVALLAALGLERGGRGVRQATGLVLLLLAAAAWIGARHGLGRVVGVEPPEAFVIPPGVWLALAAWAFAAFRIVDGPPARAALLVALGLTAAWVGLARHDRALGSPRALVALLREHRAAGEPVVEFARFNAGLPFHLRERVRLLEVPRETRFDDPRTVAAVFVSRDSLAALADRHGRVWLAGPEGPTRTLADTLGLAWTRLARWKDTAIGFVTR
jgi:4-amino-4-deoxy-L-arabinose transferase